MRAHMRGPVPPPDLSHTTRPAYIYMTHTGILQIPLFSKLTPALLLAVVHLFVAAQYAVVVVVANDVAEDVVHKWLRPPFPSTEIKRKKKKKANARKES